jgi:hypothetical protein
MEKVFEAAINEACRARDAEIARLRGAFDNQEMVLEAARSNQAQVDARVAQLEAALGDALNELAAALDGNPNPKAREFADEILERILDGEIPPRRTP